MEEKVYVVPLRDARPSWASLSWREFVEHRNCYFHPVNKRNYPKEPVAWIGFRYRGRLLSIHRVKQAVTLNCRSELTQHVPEVNGEAFRASYDQGRCVPHYFYMLGPPIVPDHEIRSGNVFGSGHLWIDRDLLLSSGTVEEAFVQTKKRRES